MVARRFLIPPVIFFAVAGFMMDGVFGLGLLSDAFFADTRFAAGQLDQGILGGVSALAYALGCLFFGPLSDRIGRRRMVVVAVVLTVGASLATPFCPNMKWLVALVTFRRFIVSFYWPPLMAWMADASSPRNLARNLIVFNISWTLGLTVGNSLAGPLGDWGAVGGGASRPFAPYWVSAGAAALLLVWIAVFEPHAKDRRPDLRRLLEAERSRWFLMQGWTTLFAVFFTSGLCVFMLPRLAAIPSYGLSEVDQSLIHSLRTAVSLAAYAAMWSTAHWHFRLYPLCLSLGAVGAGLVVLGAGAGFGAAVVGAIGLGLGAGAAYMISLYYSLGLPRERGRGIGVHEALLGLGNAFGPALGGLAGGWTGNPRAPFLFGAAPIVAALGLVILLNWRKNHGGREPSETS